ncbi:MAG: alpha-amylase/alpha-mannosidase [Planctomycetia bacterium]|nr:alpha-amylase/alpha-mannosidase [Planctomycetia bacterium]
MSDIALAFFWHQHQPYYPDDVTGENPMPWVRLHGVKDYYGMALHLLEYPAMRCTINLVPSLLVQLEAYTHRGASDRLLDLTRLPADGLAEKDALALLDQFFMANPDTMVRPHPRYFELYQRRALGRNSAKDALRRFNDKDLRDLQVWFNLAWIHPLAVPQYPDLAELMQKGRHFSEAEKLHLLSVQFDILKQIVPLHRQLAESGQVELTTTPFYHPILPLLLDKKFAREAMPDIKLPKATAGYPEDAALHVRRAIAKHEEVFGQQPQGMWPAEGSVCQAMVALLAEQGIRWIATDEGVLTHSTQGFVSRDAKGYVRNPDHMYRPYKAADGGRELGIVFRDHALSDMIGFHYQRNDPVAAAEDFIQHLYAIGRACSNDGQPALVSVILDGENCWEYYPGGGVAFLRALYDRCTRSKDIKPVKIGEYLERYPPRDTLPHLFAGSWINHNFSIWIGQEEDNTAWDALHRTREHLKQRSAELGVPSPPPPAAANQAVAAAPQPVPQTVGAFAPAAGVAAPVDVTERFRRAWEELYIAEGSDWFWWYGDDHRSAQDELFDYLFRKHLQNVYLLLGDQPPADLSRPIMWRRRRAAHTVPRSFLQVKVDGRQTFFEWINAGHYTCQNERGTMAMVTTGPIKELYFGFNLDTLFLRIDCAGPAREELAHYEVRIGFLEPTGHDLLIAPSRAGQPLQFRMLREGMPLEATGVAAAFGQLAEIAIPFERLALKAHQAFQFFVELREGSQSRDRAPREGAICLTCPSPEYEQIMWDV